MCYKGKIEYHFFWKKLIIEDCLFWADAVTTLPLDGIFPLLDAAPLPFIASIWGADLAVSCSPGSGSWSLSLHDCISFLVTIYPSSSTNVLLTNFFILCLPSLLAFFTIVGDGVTGISSSSSDSINLDYGKIMWSEKTCTREQAKRTLLSYRTYIAINNKTLFLPVVEVVST